MTNKIEKLRAMLETGTFHHATYRDIGSLWEGLYIYPRGAFRGFGPPEIVFNKGEPELKLAQEIVGKTGWSLGSYGNG